jgi:hypothetical protein
MAFDAGYELPIILFPNFRTSVVEVSGSNYIPLSYSSLNGFLAITSQVNQPMRSVILHPDAFKTCKPVGDLILLWLVSKLTAEFKLQP